MPNCQHLWEMVNIQFGFVVFEKCSHCDGLRTYFSAKDHPMEGDEYREENCIWRCMESAQSFQFNIQCKKCNQLEKFSDIMGLLYCTGCLPDCEVEILQKKYEKEKTWVMVAFGFLPRNETQPLSPQRLKILEDHFNQRRETSRSKIAILSYDLIADFSHCRGEFIHDIGMLSLKPPGERKQLF
jgi:hypothetical protein